MGDNALLRDTKCKKWDKEYAEYRINERFASWVNIHILSPLNIPIFDGNDSDIDSDGYYNGWCCDCYFCLYGDVEGWYDANEFKANYDFCENKKSRKVQRRNQLNLFVKKRKYL